MDEFLRGMVPLGTGDAGHGDATLARRGLGAKSNCGLAVETDELGAGVRVGVGVGIGSCATSVAGELCVCAYGAVG